MKEKLTGMRSSQDLLAEDLERDPEFHREWERTELARAVALVVVAYRAKHNLSQRRLAEHLGWKPSQIARMELGEHNPSLETLIFLSHKLGLRLTLAIDPPGSRRTKVRPAKGVVIHERDADGSHLLLAVGA